MEFDDEEPVGPEYIFGDTSPSPHDLEPTQQTKTGISVGFRKVANDFDFKAFSARVRKNTLRKASTSTVSDTAGKMLKIGRPVTYTEIPDKDSRTHPLYGFNPDNYTEEESPERKAEEELLVENVIEIEQDDLDRIEGHVDVMATEVGTLLLDEGAALLMSFDNASAKAEATLRDGLGVTSEMDGTVSEALSHMIRLNVINSYMARLSLPEEIKSKFMGLMTEKIADDAHAAMSKTMANDKYRAILENLQARVKTRGSQQPDVAKEGKVVAGPMGVVRRQGGGAGVAPPSSDTAEDTHGFNERQNAGVRLT